MNKYQKHGFYAVMMILLGMLLMWYFPDQAPVHKGDALGMLFFYCGIMYAVGVGTWWLFMFFGNNLWNK